MTESGRESLIRGVLIALALPALMAAGLAVRPVRAAPPAPQATPRSVASRDTISPEGRRSGLDRVVAHDPFRRSRLPTTRRYDAAAMEAAKLAPPPATVAKPPLALTGILWGAAPAALIEGVPGVDGTRLFHQGDTAGGVRLRSLSRDHAVLAGFDTTWTLVIRRPWQ